ncbi:molybdopterin molybdotransferase MoeA [Dyella japonica]|uniref:Molybdopterin molybdenumtransferase n=1 Tax=Dyella japonica DSM 16301 TaxID=1440762 RepID=A0A0G9H7X1_9GAMM|nr:gephyrin-like molybdotransferase Glp [Dyella japonica]KLD65339.1 molybdopterin biosynthesis [Dyella japonica DSM 16301]
MIGYDDALLELLRHVRRLPAQSCKIADALSAVVAVDVASPMDLPSFDHSAMDGYALHADEPLAAGSEHAVQGSQAAGDASRASAGMAWEIMTGARLPQGLDTVVPVERTALLERREDGSPARIRLLDAVTPRANVRYAGSDVAKGRVVIKAGTRIQASQLMLLAALGVAQVDVLRAPRVAIICTGKELQADLTQALGDGQIYGSNGPYLVAAFAAMGVQVSSCETVDDTSHTFVAAVRRAQQAGVDLIVSTGAVSMGRYDFVPDALVELGAQVLFHKLAIRPGKPQLAAVLGDAMVFALPGTPMAVAVGLRFLIDPVLRAMRGQAPERTWQAVLDTPQQLKPGLRHFLRATLTQDEQGRLHANVLAQQQPFRIQPFAQADAWVVVEEEAGEVAAGQVVTVASLHPDAVGWAGWDQPGAAS